jgi:DNA recombination protein RmuC
VLAVLAFWAFRLSRAIRSEESGGVALLQQQVEALRAQVSESLSRSSDSVNRQMDAMSGQLRQQMESVVQNLNSTTGQINVRLDNASRVVQNVSQQLGSLSQATEKIFEATRNISSLEDILKPPKLRGSMGEMLLENVLREVLPSAEFFSFQYAFKTGDVVDAVIRLKDGIIPIDSKFALDNFRRMIESKDEKEREALRREFVRNMKKHIDDIARKYILPDEGTFNFALMYIPAENVYYETIIRSNEPGDGVDLYAYATQKRVFPVSPNSLYPYLMTLALGLRGLQIEKQAHEILNELARLSGDLERFTKEFRTTGEHIVNAGKKFSEADKKLEKIESKLAVLREGTVLPGAAPEIKVLE